MLRIPILQILYRKKLHRLSLKLAVQYDILPSPLILRGVQCQDHRKRHGSGAFSDVFVGMYGEVKVALKCLRHDLKAEDAEKVMMTKVRVSSRYVSTNSCILNTHRDSVGSH